MIHPKQEAVVGRVESNEQCNPRKRKRTDEQSIEGCKAPCLGETSQKVDACARVLFCPELLEKILVDVPLSLWNLNRFFREVSSSSSFFRLFAERIGFESSVPDLKRACIEHVQKVLSLCRDLKLPVARPLSAESIFFAKLLLFRRRALSLMSCNFVLTALKIDGLLLKNIEPPFILSRDIVLAAVKQNSEIFGYIPKEFTRDKEIVLAAVTKDGGQLFYASNELKNDREVVLVAVAQNGTAILHASEALRNDPEVIHTAIRQNRRVFDFFRPFSESSLALSSH